MATGETQTNVCPKEKWREGERESETDTQKKQDMRGEDTCCSCQKVTTIRHTLGMPSKADSHSTYPRTFFSASSSSLSLCVCV